MVKLTLLMLVLSLLCLAVAAQKQEEPRNIKENLNIVHYQPEQVHLAFGGMWNCCIYLFTLGITIYKLLRN